MTQHSTVMKCIAVLFDALSHCFDIYEYSICRHSERTTEKKVKGTREGMQPKGSLLLLLTCVVRSNFTGCMRVPCVRIDMALCHHRRFCSCPAFLSLSISPSLSFSPCFSCFLSSCMFFFSVLFHSKFIHKNRIWMLFGISKKFITQNFIVVHKSSSQPTKEYYISAIGAFSLD